MSQKVVLLKSQVTQRGGLEKYAARIAHCFQTQGFDVSILTTRKTNDSQEHPDIPVYSVNTCRWPAFWRMEQFDRFVKKFLDNHPADIIFGMDRNRIQTHYRAGNGVHAAFLKSRALVEGKWKQFSFKINPLHLKILELEKAAFENPSLKKLFTNSHMVRKQILETYSTDPKKIEVIHNGVEWHEMEKDFQLWIDEKKSAAQHRQLDPNHFHFLFIGNGYLRKGLMQLMHAFSYLNRKDVHLSVIGKDSDQKKYEALARKLKIDRQIYFFGPQKDIRPFYQIADSLVIPSFYDPFANVTVEALAMGLFVVSSLSNGGHEILQPMESLGNSLFRRSDQILREAAVLEAEANVSKGEKQGISPKVDRDSRNGGSQAFLNGAVIGDLLDIDSITESLKIALSHPKTIANAHAIRQSVQHLDFSNQLQHLINSCITSERS